MTGDGTHTYQWDAENRMISVDGGSTATYEYNVLGQRVERFLPNGSWTFDYLFGVGGEELGLYSAGTAAWFDQDVPMGGRLLVKYGSPLRILHTNNLGTTTVVTDQTGAELGDMLYYPWGQAWMNTGAPYDRHFAGMQGFESPESLYPTDFRKYTPALGRWMSPDPVGGDVTNPQSLNRCAYVLNDPCSLSDSLGLSPCSFHIAVKNAGLINKAELGMVQGEIAKIFATANVGIRFQFAGSADYTLNVSTLASGSLFNFGAPPTLPPGNAGGITPPLTNTVIANYGSVFVDQQLIFGYSSPSSLTFRLGEAGAHEAGHYLLHIGDSPNNIGIMAPDMDSPYFFPAFTGVQADVLQKQCSKFRKRGNSPVPSGRGGSGGGAEGGGFAVVSWLVEGSTTEVDYSGDTGPGSGWCPKCTLPPLDQRHRC